MTEIRVSFVKKLVDALPVGEDWKFSCLVITSCKIPCLSEAAQFREHLTFHLCNRCLYYSSLDPVKNGNWLLTKHVNEMNSLKCSEIKKVDKLGEMKKENTGCGFRSGMMIDYSISSTVKYSFFNCNKTSFNQKWGKKNFFSERKQFWARRIYRVRKRIPKGLSPPQSDLSSPHYRQYWFGDDSTGWILKF